MQKIESMIEKVLNAGHGGHSGLGNRKARLLFIEREDATGRFWATGCLRAEDDPRGRVDVGDDGEGHSTIVEALEYTLRRIEEVKGLRQRRKGYRKAIEKIDNEIASKTDPK